MKRFWINVYAMAVILFCLMLALTAYAGGDDKNKPQNVNVVNTPSVNVVNKPSVGIDPLKNRVALYSVDGNDIYAIATSVIVNAEEDSFQNIFPITTRFEINTVSVNCYAPISNFIFADILYTIPNLVHTPNIRIPLGVLPPIGNIAQYSYASYLPLSIPAGSTLALRVLRGSEITESAGCTFSLIGHLFP